MNKLVIETNPTPEKCENLEVVKSATDSPLAISNDLPSFSRMEAGKLRLGLDELGPRDHLGGIVDSLDLKDVEAEVRPLGSHAMKEDEDRDLTAGRECLTRERQAPPDGAEGEEDDLAESPDPMDLEAALERMDGDRVFLGEMVVMFLEESPGLMSQVRDSLTEADPASMVVPAHNLKNWAGNLEASAMFAELARFEAFGRAGQLAEARASLPNLERELGRLTRVLAQSIAEPQPPRPR